MTATLATPACRLALLLTLGLTAAGCSSNDGGGGGGGGLGAGSVSGLVMDISTGAGIAGVTVSAAGQTATTDSRGYFSVTGLATGPVTVSASKSGFAPGYATPRASNQSESTLITLKQQGASQTYVASSDKTLSQRTEAGPYAVTFVASSLDTSDTNLKVSITPVDPTKESKVLPGSLVTTDSSVLFPVTFAEFTILDSSGKRVQLKAGQSATVELPIPPRLRATYPGGSKIHCYAFNAASGAWDDFVDGTVRASSVDGSTPVLAAAIKHFSWYGGAPQGTDCVEILGRVVSKVDGKPLGNARVEATPGGYTYSDPDGNFSVIGKPSGTLTAYQTGFDIDGSLTGMKGAKYIEFGEVQEDLAGLTKMPCSTTATPPAPPPSGTLGGPDNRVVVNVGAITKAAYEVTASLSGGSGEQNGSIIVTVMQGLPGPDGKLQNPTPASGARITIASGTASATLVELAAGSGAYTLVGKDPFVIGKGQSYQLAIDADGNGSIDGSGSASVVGDLALVTPAAAGAYPAAGFTASWTDTGTSLGGPSYSAVYFLTITGGASIGYYVGTDLSFLAYDLIKGPGNPLPAGAYSASLVAYSGFAASGGTMISQSNNITGVGVSGTAFSVGTAPTVTFQLQ
jgi:hypothetical protein